MCGLQGDRALPLASPGLMIFDLIAAHPRCDLDHYLDDAGPSDRVTHSKRQADTSEEGFVAMYGLVHTGMRPALSHTSDRRPDALGGASAAVSPEWEAAGPGRGGGHGNASFSGVTCVHDTTDADSEWAVRYMAILRPRITGLASSEAARL